MIDYNDLINKMSTGKPEKSENAMKDYIKTDIIGNTILGRILPDFKTMVKKNDYKTMPFEYHHHGWKSKFDGSGLFFMCANNMKQKCPICTQSIKMWRSDDPITKKDSEAIRKRTNYLVNFYVINNPAKPEDNGKVKLLRFGKQLYDKYLMATEGDDKEFYGDRIWRLDASGCTFRIKCEATAGKAGKSQSKKGDVYPTYNNSGFLPAGAIEGMTEEKMKIIYESTFELPKIYTQNTVKELQDALEKHFMCSDNHMVNTSIETNVETDIDIRESTETVDNTTKTNTSTSADEQSIDDIISDLKK